MLHLRRWDGTLVQYQVLEVHSQYILLFTHCQNHGIVWTHRSAESFILQKIVWTSCVKPKGYGRSWDESQSVAFCTTLNFLFYVSKKGQIKNGKSSPIDDTLWKIQVLDSPKNYFNSKICQILYFLSRPWNIFIYIWAVVLRHYSFFLIFYLFICI